MLKINESNKVDAREIYNLIEVKSRFNGWINESFDFIGAIENKDFYRKNGKSTGGRPTIEYDVSIECAKELCLVQRSSKSKELRLWLISMSTQHDTGLAFTATQIDALMDLSRAMTLVSIQKEVEKKHFAIYNDKYTWYQYRAALLGYDTKDVIEAMRKINKKYHTTRASLIQLDANELIRTGVIDFMLAMGKTTEYATNVGNLCKSISSKMKLGNIIWDDTKENPLQINKSEIAERQNNFSEVKKLMS